MFIIKFLDRFYMIRTGGGTAVASLTGGLAAAPASSPLLARHAQPNPDGNPDPGFLCSGSELKPRERQTFICTCMLGKFMTYRHSSVSCIARAPFVCVNNLACRDGKDQLDRPVSWVT